MFPMELDITHQLSRNTSEHTPQNTYGVYADIMKYERIHSTQYL
jgi:hypothetical protein